MSQPERVAEEGPVLQVDDLHISFAGRVGLGAGLKGEKATIARAVDGVSLELHRGEVLALAGGATPAVRLLRLPEQAYDTRAEVWLDPARHYLPLRVQLSNPPSARDALQLEWRGALAGHPP